MLMALAGEKNLKLRYGGDPPVPLSPFPFDLRAACPLSRVALQLPSVLELRTLSK